MRQHLARAGGAATQHGKIALLSALCSAQLLMPLPAIAAPPTLNEAIVQVSEATHPILKALDKERFPAFSEKVAALILSSPTIKPDKLGAVIELGIDVFNSVPPEKVFSHGAPPLFSAYSRHFRCCHRYIYTHRCFHRCAHRVS